jgi:hypothetical protein
MLLEPNKCHSYFSAMANYLKNKQKHNTSLAESSAS